MGKKVVTKKDVENETAFNDTYGIVTLPHALVHKPRPNRRTDWLVVM
jgi:hypothetical protein